MATYDDPKYREIDYKHRNRLDELRERQQQKLEEINERMTLQKGFEVNKSVVESETSLELEQLRHELRQAEREPNFEDFQKRAELEFLIRRQERLDQNKFDNNALERRVTELRSLNRHEIHKLVLMAGIEHLHSEEIHRRTVAELRESVEAEMMKAEQAHRHKVHEDNNASRLRMSEMTFEKLFERESMTTAHHRTVAELQEAMKAEILKAEQTHRHKVHEDNNASRLKVSEMFSEKFFEYVFSQMKQTNGGLSSGDLEKIIADWEKEGDKLKR